MCCFLQKNRMHDKITGTEAHLQLQEHPGGSVDKSEWVKSLSRIRLFATPRTVAHQAPPSMEFSRQEYWSGLPFPSPGDLPDQGIEPRSLTLQADALPSELPGNPLLPMQGTWVPSLVWEDPTCLGATMPVCHSLWACALQQEKPPQWEAQAHCN